MTNNNLRIIKGGLDETSYKGEKKFVSAYVTNTRLMGVLALYIHWSLPDNLQQQDLHQFFYYDAEEFGLETYRSVLGNDKISLDLIYHSMIGGLGSKKMELSEKEAIYLINDFVKFNSEHNISLPGDLNEYKFILKKNPSLKDSEIEHINQKVCVDIQCNNDLCTYFLMRCFAKDFSFAKLLSCDDIKLDLFPEFKAATLCKNTVDPAPQEDACLCESLIEFDDNYYIVITHLTIANKKICHYERVSYFKISPPEAAMILSRPEYITVYDYIGGEYEFNRDSTELTKDSLITVHEFGSMYMVFHDNNDHVTKRIFRLNEDVLGVFYVTKFNQLIIAAYDLASISAIEKDINRSPLKRQVLMSSKYEFQEPILFEFVNSGLEDFEEFIDLISDDEDE